MPTERMQICTLRLVYPPISNQEAEWIRTEPGVPEILKQSNFYVIGSRAESKFENLDVDQRENTLCFDFVVGNNIRDRVKICVNDLPGLAGDWTGTMEVECGPKFFRIWNTDQTGNRSDEILSWFTTEKLLFDFWRGQPGIHGLNRLRDLTTYEMLYAGISKRDDAFERLLNKPHDKRLRILANEPQIAKGARVTDETFLFFFKTDVFRIHTFDFMSDISEEDLYPDLQDDRIVVDAEKAFVSFIQSRYNSIQYKNYPRGSDGLFGSDLVRYCYSIGEDLTFHGPGAEIVGAFESCLPASNNADAIFIEGEMAHLIKAEDMAKLVADSAGRES